MEKKYKQISEMDFKKLNQKNFKKYLSFLIIYSIIKQVIDYYYLSNSSLSLIIGIILTLNLFFILLFIEHFKVVYKAILIFISILFVSNSIYLNPSILPIIYFILLFFCILIVFDFKKDRFKIWFLILSSFIFISFAFYMGIQTKNKIVIESEYFIVNLILAIYLVIFSIYFFIKKIILHKQFALINSYTHKKKQPQIITKLIDYAKNDKGKFMELFTEIHPKFIENITTQYPTLTSNEINFCAFILLDFTSKEIATYTDNTYRSVQSKKYLLRKKMNLFEREDLYSIMKNLNE